MNQEIDPNEKKYARHQSSNFLCLKNHKPINKGNSRLVFEYPDDPTLIIKVLRPDIKERRFGGQASWHKRHSRFGGYRSYTREIQEYIAVHWETGEAPLFLQKVVGLVNTDLGLGMVTEAARSVNGEIAPSIAMLIDSDRFDSNARRDLELFYQQICSCDVVISDMNMGNLVYAISEANGSCFVLIDGLGNANFLPLKVISRRINLRSKRLRYQRLCKRIAARMEARGLSMPGLDTKQ